MSDYFPEEIIHKILLRLPIKSLIKFTAICKSWMSLIKSSAFIQSHLRSTIDYNDKNDAHLLLLSASSCNDNILHQHHRLHWDSPEFGEHSKLSNPVTLLKCECVSDLRVVGTCNGLVCLEEDHSYRDRSTTVFWNPCIRKIVILPSPPSCFTSSEYGIDTMHGFGYDSRSNDYKVLRVATLVDDQWTRLATAVQVYSLARGSWRSLSTSDVPIELHGDCNITVFVNGILHTLEARALHDHAEEHRTHDHGRVYDNFIASFNLATEVYGEITIPEALQTYISSISRYGDSLALINYDCDTIDMVNYGCDIWVMKDYGVAESWTFLYNIVMFDFTLYGFKRCGEVVLKETDLHGEARMVSLDPKSKQVKDLGTKDNYIYHYMDSFVESLVLLDHASAISYQGEISIVPSVLSMATYVDCKSERVRVLVQNYKLGSDLEQHRFPVSYLRPAN